MIKAVDKNLIAVLLGGYISSATVKDVETGRSGWFMCMYIVIKYFINLYLFKTHM